MNRVLAVDPGYDRLGWAVGSLSQRKLSNISFDCIVTNRSATLAERYRDIDCKLQTLIRDHTIDTLVIEKVFFSKNSKTALQIAEVRGVIISTATRHNIAIAEYNPTTIKLAVAGDGRADKKAVEKLVYVQLKVKHTKVLDDAIDALAILLTHALLTRT